MSTSQILDQSVLDDDTSKLYNYNDNYQQKYFETLKSVQMLSEKYL